MDKIDYFKILQLGLQLASPFGKLPAVAKAMAGTQDERDQKKLSKISVTICFLMIWKSFCAYRSFDFSSNQIN